MTATDSTLTGQPHLRRILGRLDLALVCVVAVVNLNFMPVIASIGPVVLWLWLLALAFFFWPMGIAVIELSHRFPGEGGCTCGQKGYSEIPTVSSPAGATG